MISLAKNTLALCLLLSTLSFTFAQATLNKDDDKIIDPKTGDIFLLDPSSVDNDRSCQLDSWIAKGYFFNQNRTKITNMENCHVFIKKQEDNNTSTGTWSIETNTGSIITTGQINTGATTTGNTNTGSVTSTGTNDVIQTGTATTGNQQTISGSVTTTGTNNWWENNNSDDSENLDNSRTVIIDSYQHDDKKSEIENAIAWMYTNWLTKFPTVEEYRTGGLHTREQWAKFISQLSKILDYQSDENYNCEFYDFNQTHEWLKEWVTYSCEHGIFKWDSGNFLPKAEFSYAQSLTVLIKIFQWNTETEKSSPRWKWFYTKAKALGLLNNLRITEETIYNTTTRWDIAIMMYRLRNIMKETNNLAKIPGENEEKIDTEVIVKSTNYSNQSLSFEWDPEFQEALWWMRDLWMTSAKNTIDFQPLVYLQRQYASKFIGIFHQTYFNGETDNIPNECFYDDLQDSSNSVRSYIFYVCQNKLINASGTLFLPSQNITQAEFVASLVRMLDKNIIGSWEQVVRREPYFDRALELWIVQEGDKVNFELPVTRYQVALQLYRFNVKYKFLQSLEKSTISPNDILTVFDDSINETLDNSKEKKIAINTNKLFDEEWRIGIIELFNNKKYTLQKEKSISIFTNSTNWFWSLKSITTDEQKWTVNLLLNTDSRLIIEWTIRMSNGEVFHINPSEFTTAYYIMTKIKDADQTNSNG